MLLIQLSLSHSIYMVGHTALGAWQRVPQSLCLSTWWGGGFFSGSVSPDERLNSRSVVGVRPGDSGMMIGCQVDEFT